MKDIAIVWFRNDLRIHDNEALHFALNNAEIVVPVYVYDDRFFLNKTPNGFHKTGVFRRNFINESVDDLKKNLCDLGLNLFVRSGFSENIIFDLAKELKSSWVICNRERTDEEVKIQDKLEQKLWTIGQEMVYTRGKMLYYTSDLPFPVTHTPEVFTNFRKEVEKIVPIRKPLTNPEITTMALPNLDWSGNESVLEAVTMRSKSPFHGGETAGLKQLNYYLWESKSIQHYKDTRNDMLGWDYSSKFSPWLAIGALSPKTIYDEVKKFEAIYGENESTYWIIFELLWRDYFRLIGKKHGNKIFQSGGLTGKKIDFEDDMDLYRKWTVGETGVPVIDANMRELNATGFMSNRGRQLTASFLVKDLKINWLLGAEYFESQLIDYDPCSNYCNWLYIAGLGNDPREDRYFNILNQAKRYDHNGEYVKYWIPELNNIDTEFVHTPFNTVMDSKNTYPRPIIDINKWLS